MKAGLKMKGKYKIELIRNNNRELLIETSNGVTNEGLNSILDTMFHGAGQISDWFIGLIDNTNFTAVDPSDTMSSHAGWQELDNYSDATRIGWNEDAASGGTITNSVAVTFTISADGTIKGLFLSSDSTKSGTVGQLWATAVFPSAVQVLNGDALKVTYTVTASAN